MLHLLRREQLLSCKRLPDLHSKHLQAGQALLQALNSRILYLSWDRKDIANFKGARVLHQIYPTWIRLLTICPEAQI